MKRILLATTLLLGMAFLMPTVFSPAEAKITETKVNGGGQTPKGEANGVPSTAKNPAGHEPAGHNK
jgi:hypothetical protein